MTHSLEIAAAAIRIKETEPFITAIIKRGGIPHFVGGYVRDMLLGKEPKDIDIVVGRMNLTDIQEAIKDFGKVDVVGESFAVVKFKSDETGVTYDIAAPRIDKKIGTGHKGFEVISHEGIRIAQDLFRRDFTMNSIAVNILTHEIIDPYEGIKDIEYEHIRMTNPDAFIDDPLRILRAVQFAVRFGFVIEHITWKLMEKHISLVADLSGDRIHEELMKIHRHNGSPIATYKLLRKLDFYTHIGWALDKYDDKRVCFLNNIVCPDGIINTTGEFFYFVLGLKSYACEFYMERLHGTTQIFKQIKALEHYHRNMVKVEVDEFHPELLAASLLKITTDVYDFVVLDEKTTEALRKMKSGKLPAFVRDLEVDGNDAIRYGLEGKNIGIALQQLFELVITGKMIHHRSNLLGKLNEIAIYMRKS